MIKCLSKKRTYKKLLENLNEVRVDSEAVKKEYAILEKYLRMCRADLERASKKYEGLKSEFGDIIIKKLLAEEEGKEIDAFFMTKYNSVQSRMVEAARSYNREKVESEEAEDILKKYTEEKEKCELAEREAKRALGVYLVLYIEELLAEREKTKNELKVFIEECEKRFGCWYRMNEADEKWGVDFCECVFCGNSNSRIPWHNKNYVCKTYLSRTWTKEHQEALNKLNSMKETLKEIQELLEIICFAKEKHEYGEEKFSRRIAKNICEYRKLERIDTTGKLVSIIEKSIPKFGRAQGHPAKRTFQAIRIEVNNEIEPLYNTVRDCIDVLNPKGRLCIITFHSLEDRIVKETFKKYLQTANIPDPDIVVRTSGEQRLSNFMMYQCAYSELYFPKTHWPDFREKELEEAIIAFQSRDRRFGAIKK